MPIAHRGRLGEAVATGAVGAAAGALVAAPLGFAVPFGAVAGVNGLSSGWRRIYDWRRPTGIVAFFLDSTWAVPMTSAALVANAVGTASPVGGYVPELSERQNRHVFRRGFMPRRGFAITLGNVISGAGDPTVPSRRRLVTDHETVHVWQARWFGPLFPFLYGGWMVGGAVAGAVTWAVRHRDQKFTKVVETCAYYLNPFEWWAYSRDSHWPPSGKVAGLGWRRPMVRSFAALRGAA